MALPPVGDELLVKLQLEKEAAFAIRTASSGTKLSYIQKKRAGITYYADYAYVAKLSLTCNVRLYAPPPTQAEFLSNEVFLTARILLLATSNVFMLIAPPVWTQELSSNIESVITISLSIESR